MPVQDVAGWPAEVVQAAAGAITVWVGAPSALTSLGDGGLQLVVEADRFQAERWRTAWPERHQLVVSEQVLAARSGVPVRWCLFNDARLNGPLDQSTWCAHYPNLRQLGMEQRMGCSLADLLTGLGEHLPHGPQSRLRLHLQQGDPLEALKGLGAWLQGLEFVQLTMPVAGLKIWGSDVGGWLELQGFRACEEEAACWQRDAIASQRPLLQERDQALARVQELEAQLQQLSQDNETLRVLRERHQDQLDQIVRELDSLQQVVLDPSNDPFVAMQHLLQDIQCPIIFDVGAHHGHLAQKFRHLFPAALIYAFEPFPASFETLKTNLPKTLDINVLNLGLADSRGLRLFHSNNSSVTNSLLATDVHGSETWGQGLLETAETIEAEFETLDSILSSMNIPRIDILKLDVQGAEPLVMAGSIEACRQGKIKIIYAEIIIQPTYVGQMRADRLLGTFYDYGFELFNIYNPSYTRKGLIRQVDVLFVLQGLSEVHRTIP